MLDPRYQYQPWYIKLWRRRYYIPVPFKVLRSKLRVPHEPWYVLWSIHIGLAQCAMQWTYKWEDIKDDLYTGRKAKKRRRSSDQNTPE